MQIIGPDDIHRLLDFPSLIAALRDMFREGCEVPPRHHHSIATGAPDAAPATLLLMPAWQPGRALGIKIVSVFPDNASRALPSVHGSYLLLDPETGVPLALLDGTALTLRRTAAASALAADYLARPDSAVHLMVGTGALASYLIAAHRAARPIRETRIWGRDPHKAAALATRLTSEGLAAVPVTDLAGAVADADIISCATLAQEPLIRGEWLRPGTHLDLVGGFTPAMREADDEAVRRARVYIDTEVAMREAGDIVQPLRSGLLVPETIAGDLFRLARGECAARRDPGEITLFKSVGTALEDLAAAQLAFGRIDPISAS
ncbi:MAG: ornithine cyclodeaminase family protein [Alphaproteobacteria bacterium]|nr:ornithine cyclodeaminase family protein [Alphaproteobacteria bacterium]